MRSLANSTTLTSKCKVNNHPINCATRLKSMLGIQRIRTTPYHPSSNGMVERLHRTLKQDLRCHDTKWTESSPVVLLGLRTCMKEDLSTF
ncbi:transposon Tf2-9 polyprotein [Trichonephila clavipes]|nr:transposon Tf2-9 polyprotein [Trichonephila clavipes]